MYHGCCAITLRYVKRKVVLTGTVPFVAGVCHLKVLSQPVVGCQRALQFFYSDLLGAEYTCHWIRVLTEINMQIDTS